VREHLINRITQDFEDQCAQIEESVQKVAEQLAEEEKIQQGNDERNLEKFEEIEGTMGIFQATVSKLEGNIKETTAEHRRDEAQLEAFLALQGVLVTLEVRAAEEKLHAEAQQRAEEDQTLVISIDKQRETIEDLRKEQDAIIENARDLIQSEYAKRIAAVHQDLRRETQRLWEESLLAAKEEQGEVAVKPQESTLVAMNNKVYRLAQKQETPKPKLV